MIPTFCKKNFLLARMVSLSNYWLYIVSEYNWVLDYLLQ